MNKKIKKKILIGGYFLGLFTLLLFCGISYSSYVTRANVEAQSAKTAGIVIKTTADENTSFELNADQTEASFHFDVTNENGGKVSEVSASYSIYLTLPEAIIPDGLTITLDSKTGEQDNNKISFINVGSFKANEAKTNSHTLTFAITDDFSDSISWEEILLDVHLEQTM